MTPAEVQFWNRVQQRASGLSPDIAAALLRAWEMLRESLSLAEWQRIVESGGAEVDRILTAKVMDKAFAPVRDKIRNTVNKGALYFLKDTPKLKPIQPTRDMTFAFDILNPDVIAAIRKLETKVIDTVKGDVRETVRAHVENSLRDGTGPRAAAKSLRNVLGLSPAQEKAVRNYEEMLRAGDREALSRQLRDRRFDSTLKKALGANGDGLTEQQIERMTEIYRKRMVSFNANTISHTASLDAMKLGQRLSIDSAVQAGIYDPDRLVKRWVGVMDERERPEHVAMEDETVPYDEVFSNGEMMPGDSTYNCRCVAVYTQTRAQ